MENVFVSGSFDDLRAEQVRFLEAAARYGELYVMLWPDEAVEALRGHPPKFRLVERQYILQSIRYVSRVIVPPKTDDPDSLPYQGEVEPHVWAVDEASDNAGRRLFAASYGLYYQIIRHDSLKGWPVRRFDALEAPSGRKKVIVTGSFDWLHSGHIRFFEEASQLGDLYVAVGHDANIRLLKGEGHPLYPQEQRRYFVQAVRYVKRALITSGNGWMDAEPEIQQLRPDIYAVNEDGDKPEKRRFCAEHGIQYVVLKREPKQGLPRRESTLLRGF
jgi:cytidyltransferase-like protein